MPSCLSCDRNFDSPPEDIAFYDRVSPVIAEKKYAIPSPQKCPDCRMQQRFMFRNFFHLSHRTCDLSGKKIISMYRDNAVFPVYDMHEWWSDKWDPFSYGLPAISEKTPLQKIQKLHETVPRMAIMNTQCENTDFCNLSFGSKDCYLVFGNVQNEDCSYGHIVWQSQNCYDCLYTYRSELCYECVDAVQCYNVAFSVAVENCIDSLFLRNCTNCKYCFGCVGLKNAKYHIFNKPYSRAEYEEKMKAFNQGNYRTIAFAQQRVHELIGKEIVKYYHGFNAENCTGDYLYNCKNTIASYDAKNCEDVKYSATLESFSDSQDCNYSPSKTELSYQNVAISGYHILFSHNCIDCSDITYCDNCYNCKHCFGCVGLKAAEYAIFNTQYSKEEYERILPQVIEQMQQNKTWGEFFDRAFSPFAYNESMANEYYPLTREEVLVRGWKWQDEDAVGQKYMGPTTEIPEDIRDVESSICQQVLQCEVTGKPYKIIPQELEFYKKMKLPLPRKCFLQRHKERMALRNPRKLWERRCANCQKNIQTTYAPERPETVYCEECYLQQVY